MDRAFKIIWQAAIIVLACSSLAFGQARPKVVTMKSGAQYEGLIGSIEKIGIQVPDVFGARNIVIVNDGLRRVLFNKNRIRNNLGDSNRNEILLPVFQKVASSSAGFGGSVLTIGPFNEYGHRTITLRDRKGQAKPITQGIVAVSPRFVELKTLVGSQRQWTMRIGTGMVPTKILIPLLRKQITVGDLAGHQKIADFLIQARYYGLASEELNLIGKRFPDNERLAADIVRTRSLLKQQAARQILIEARLRMSSGQTTLARQLLTSAIKTEGVAGEILAEFREIQDSADVADRALDQTRQKLKSLFESAPDLSPEQSTVAKRLADELEQELNPVNAPRLDAWLRLADDSSAKPAQKLALAISGWLLGSNQAINNLAVAESMFATRDLVVEYLNTKQDENARRDKILTALESLESGTPAFLAAMVAQLKPPTPPAAAALTGAEPISLTVEMPGTLADPAPVKIECLATVPPQYDPYRRYPLLLALPGRQTATQELNAWSGRYNPKLQVRTGQATRNGYIVVTVDWKQTPGQRQCNYSGFEHAAVLKSLRAALRAFSIDTDRVFLVGRGIGGSLAYDIGLSHPEHWAGVVGISGALDRYAHIYDSNEHVPLPIYSVVGDKDALTISKSRDAWNTWLQSSRYVNCTVVQYWGRANEALPEEFATVFDWMKLHKRRWPGREGFELECKSLRPWDNYFWFFELHDIPLENIVWPEKWRWRPIKPLKIAGDVSPDRTNTFSLQPRNIDSAATLWLSPDYCNFAERISIKGLGKDFNGFATPSRRVLLEDVRTRSDRQRPYHAKVVCENGIWTP